MSPGLLASSWGAEPVGDWKTVRGVAIFGPGPSRLCASNTAVEPSVNAISNRESLAANVKATAGPGREIVRRGAKGISSSDVEDANAARSSERLETMRAVEN